MGLVEAVEREDGPDSDREGGGLPLINPARTLIRKICVVTYGKQQWSECQEKNGLQIPISKRYSTIGEINNLAHLWVLDRQCSLVLQALAADHVPPLAVPGPRVPPMLHRVPWEPSPRPGGQAARSAPAGACSHDLE